VHLSILTIVIYQLFIINSMIRVSSDLYLIICKAIYSPILAVDELHLEFRGMLASNLDVLAADDLFPPSRLCIIQVVGCIIEPGNCPQLVRVQGPHNVRVPPLQLYFLYFTASFDLQLLESNYTILIVCDYKLALLNFFPLWQLPPQKILIIVNQC